MAKKRKPMITIKASKESLLVDGKKVRAVDFKTEILIINEGVGLKQKTDTINHSGDRSVVEYMFVNREKDYVAVHARVTLKQLRALLKSAEKRHKEFGSLFMQHIGPDLTLIIDKE